MIILRVTIFTHLIIKTIIPLGKALLAAILEVKSRETRLGGMAFALTCHARPKNIPPVSAKSPGEAGFCSQGELIETLKRSFQVRLRPGRPLVMAAKTETAASLSEDGRIHPNPTKVRKA